MFEQAVITLSVVKGGAIEPHFNKAASEWGMAGINYLLPLDEVKEQVAGLLPEDRIAKLTDTDKEVHTIEASQSSQRVCAV